MVEEDKTLLFAITCCWLCPFQKPHALIVVTLFNEVQVNFYTEFTIVFTVTPAFIYIVVLLSAPETKKKL